MLKRVLLITMVGATLACGGDQTPAGDAADAAARAGAESSAKVSGEGAPRYQLTVTRVLPGQGSDYAIFSLGGVAEHPVDGRLAVLLRDERRIIVFDTAGKILYTAGREGSGPGEFRFPATPQWLGDTLWVSDGALSRLTPFGPTGKAGKSLSIPAMANSFLLKDGSVASMPARFYRPGGGSESIPLVVNRTTRSGKELPPLLAMTRHWRVLQFNGTVIGPQPFDDGELLDMASDGSGLVVVERSTENRENSFTVTRVGVSGDTIFRSSIEYEPVQLGDEMIDSVVRAYTETHQTSAETVTGALYLPGHLPPVTRVVAAGDGSTWLRLEATMADSVEWLVLDSSGKPAFSVMINRENEPWSIPAIDHFWAVSLDTDGMPSLVRYRVEGSANTHG